MRTILLLCLGIFEAVVCQRPTLGMLYNPDAVEAVARSKRSEFLTPRIDETIRARAREETTRMVQSAIARMWLEMRAAMSRTIEGRDRLDMDNALMDIVEFTQAVADAYGQATAEAKGDVQTDLLSGLMTLGRRPPPPKPGAPTLPPALAAPAPAPLVPRTKYDTDIITPFGKPPLPGSVYDELPIPSRELVQGKGIVANVFEKGDDNDDGDAMDREMIEEGFIGTSSVAANEFYRTFFAS